MGVSWNSRYLASERVKSHPEQRPELTVITAIIDGIKPFRRNPSTQSLSVECKGHSCQVTVSSEQYYRSYSHTRYFPHCRQRAHYEDYAKSILVGHLKLDEAKKVWANLGADYSRDEDGIIDPK